MYWPPGNGGSSSYSNWFYNFFSKSAGGYDTTVTFIDNVSYSWHGPYETRQRTNTRSGLGPPACREKAIASRTPAVSTAAAGSLPSGEESSCRSSTDVETSWSECVVPSSSRDSSQGACSRGDSRVSTTRRTLRRRWRRRRSFAWRTWTASSGLPARGVFVQFTSSGQFCLFEAPSATSPDRRGGCNSVDDPLGGSKLSASLSYEGGPQTSRVSDARLIGLVATEVAAVQIAMSDGSRRPVQLRRPTAVALSGQSYRAFGYRFDPADMRAGKEPVAVIAVDSAGKEIDRQTTGFGG